jgi:hypothetical protein
MPSSASLQSRLTLRFDDAALEDEYLADHARRAHRSWLGVQLATLIALPTQRGFSVGRPDCAAWCPRRAVHRKRPVGRPRGRLK